jgi:ceramide glucosyltransferase
MTLAIWAAGAFTVAATATHLSSIAIAAGRCRNVRHSASKTRVNALVLTSAPLGAPGVSVVRPICGIENHGEETLRSAFRLDYPRYEIIFCAASANDAAVPLVRRLMASHPHVPARLLIGNETISDNPKLNNVCKGWRAAQYDWIVMADSNVLMPRDYIQRLLATWRADTGLVASPPIGSRPDGFWAELECAFLNTYQARWQYTSDSIGLGFAQGKSMLYRKRLIENAGGIAALAAEPAEDAATTKIVRDAGLRVRLVDAPFEQPLGQRRAGDVWARQVRWARLRQASFRRYYALEIFGSAGVPLIAAAYVAVAAGLPLASVVAVAATWYGAEAALAYAAGWQLSARSPLAWMLRDLLLLWLWVDGWFGTAVVWRGHHIRTVESESTI